MPQFMLPSASRSRVALIAVGLFAAAASPLAGARNLYLLTTTNGIATVDDTAPGSPSIELPLSGLAVGDDLVAIDVRPQNNRLYGLGYNATTNAVQLYLVGNRAGANTDGPVTISGSIAGLQGAAYTNNVAATTITTLYTLDAAGDRLFIQNPPNVGTQTLPLAITLGGATLDFSGATGFDIPPGPAAAANNQPAAGDGYVALTVGGIHRLYGIGLTDGVARDLGPIGDGLSASVGLVVGDVFTDLIFADGFEP